MTAQTFSDALGEIDEKYIMEAITYEGKPTRRADNPIRHRIVRAAACILLAALLGGTVLAISPEARAAFVGWVREVYETWFVYKYHGKNYESGDVVYRPSWLPDGYTETSTPDLYEQEVIVYKNADGSLLIFGYSQNAMDLYVSRDEAIIRQTTVRGNAAELYLYEIEDAFSSLVWTDADSGLIFWITSTLDGETMVKIAESVTAQEVPKMQVIYRPAWIPDGYYEASRVETDTQTTIIYEDNDNHLITFYYVRDADAASIYLEQKGVEIKSVLISNIFADLYLDENEENANSLVWVDEKNGVLFWISANCNEEELIKIAESVTAQEVPEPQVIYRPTWIPDGFTESTRSESRDLTYFFYEDENYNSIWFAYSQNTESSSLYIEQNEVDAQTVQIGDLYADLYLDQNPGGANELVWTNMGILFWIHGNCSGEELIKIAESIVAQEIPMQEVS